MLKNIAVLSIALGLPMAVFGAYKVYGAYYSPIGDCSKLSGVYERQACHVELARKLSESR